MSANRRILLVALVALLGCVAALSIGRSVRAEALEFVFWQLRVPRVILAMVVGSSLGIAGACFQTVFANPLATPGTVGTTAGAVLGATLAAICLGGRMAYGFSAMTAAAFLGAVGVSLVVSAFAARSTLRANDIILVGLVGSIALGALSSGLQTIADTQSMNAVFYWTMGGLQQVGYRQLGVISAVMILADVVLLTQTRALDVLRLGEDHARTMGVDVARVRLIVLVAGSLAVATCFAQCGPISFVDLIVPHIVRRLLGHSRRVLLPMSLVVGGAFLAVCDLVAREALPSRELPLSVITAFLGATGLAWLLVNNRQRSGET